MTTKEYAKLNKGREVINRDECDPKARWFIIGYKERYGSQPIETSQIVIGKFTHGSIGWRIRSEYNITFVFPDPIFIKLCWNVCINNIRFKQP